jgi:hypothetical protein
MTKEALKLALEALECANSPNGDYENEITAIKEALAQPEQEPVAWGVFEGNLHDMFFSQEEAQEMAELKGTHAEVRPLYTAPPQPEQKPMHPQIQKMFEDYFDKCFRESSALDAAVQAEQEPVIDQSAAIRIATVLGWTPPRKENT